MTILFYNGEHEVSITKINVFGIEIESRRSSAKELSELLLFAHEAHKAHVNTLIKKAFYDANSNCCALVLREDVKEITQDGQAVLAVAKKTLSQFDFFDITYHGNGLQEQF